NFDFPTQPVDYIIHAAAEASAALNHDAPLVMFDTIVEGTRRVLEYAQRSQTRRLLCVSSGAVYGRQPEDMVSMAETFEGRPDPLVSGNAYGMGKCVAEFMCATIAAQGRLVIPIARPFAFLGPFLPLDRHFAAGNFLADVLRGGPIRIQGDGTPYRSYMYPTDLVEWLFTILLRGASGRAYNVGSDEAVSIGELAAVMAEIAGGIVVTTAKQPDPSRLPSRYVPNIDRSRQELGLYVRVDLRQAVNRSLISYRNQTAKEDICR
ncbi:NAD-dependent epimerase/dehydratase family protein, partial [Desulfovibrio sp. TomC]|uniref:NAD-dependent epimerase/dehydratase family protein n=1 Tax=Desulfovibrio sp. TomC TaxID=1562888 RepID=UPI0005BD6B89